MDAKKRYYLSAECARDAALLAYAFKVNGRDSFRKEASRIILERDLTLSQSDRLLRAATVSIQQSA